ncbi:MAG: IPT/TIG domain-containing protein, partial [Actinobacteria bacterium]|nr:IPT/TIG domain-containing protein [Actinomycetota bacterium]
MALLSDGRVLAWGANLFGQLGNGTSSGGPNSTPGLVVGVLAKAVAAGGKHSLALMVDGSVMAWGSNNEGQLGSALPAAPAGVAVSAGPLDKVAKIGGGATHSLAILQDGRLFHWGDEKLKYCDDQAPRDPGVIPSAVPGATNVVAMAGGLNFSLFVTTLTTADPGAGPVITGIKAAHGPTSGGTTVAITGSHLTEPSSGTPQVSFGRARAGVQSASAIKVVVTVPPGPQGSVDVTVTREPGISAVSRSGFTYFAGAWKPAVAASSSTYYSSDSHVALRLDPPGCQPGGAPAVDKAYPCGQVLDMVHDYHGSDSNKTKARVYDPAADGGKGAWRASGNLIGADPQLDARYDKYTATMLRDGRVLVVGGTNHKDTEPFNGIDTAEIYDPIGLDPTTKLRGTWFLTT